MLAPTYLKINQIIVRFHNKNKGYLANFISILVVLNGRKQILQFISLRIAEIQCQSNN